MHRSLYLAGFGYLAICAVVVIRSRVPAPVAAADIPPTLPVRFDGPAEQWFSAIKPYCNGVEVVVAQRQHPAPTTLQGHGYSAACYALGGRIDSARAVIDRLSATDRPRAAGIVFQVAHPVADAGDDRSAGPIMELVVDYWPNHYMALYHAGMAEYSLGQMGQARRHLASFLSLYSSDDGWRRNALEVVERLR